MLCICGTQLNSLSLTYADYQGAGSLTVKLGPSDLLSEPAGQLTDGTKVCQVTFVTGPKGMEFWLLGDIFLRRAYAIHDVDNVKLHLYPSGVSGGERYQPDGGTTRSPFGSHEPYAEDPFGVGFIIWLLVMVCCCCAVCFKVFRCASFGVQAREDVYNQLLD
mmetsp:Transcript_18390/g.33566  ORF Transcript_18390/g.33566 Transcript_18390/m.33566 type:complete len:162 (+) Transcript_18390:3-488(+)